MNRETSAAIQVIAACMGAVFIVAFVSNCAMNVDYTGEQRRVCMFQLEKGGSYGEGICNIRQPHWSYEYPQEVEASIIREAGKE